MLRSLILSLAFLLILSACQAPVLPPEEVLQRTFFVSSSLDSYAFSALGTGVLRSTRVLSGSVVIEGVAKRSGPWSASITSQGLRIAASRTDRVDGVAKLHAPGNGLLYFQSFGIAGDIGDELQRVLSGATMNGWSRIDTPFGQLRSTVSTPTKEIIDAQVASFLILLDRTDPKNSFYEYDVTLAPAITKSLLGTVENSESLRGTLFINRRTFALERAKWSGVNLQTNAGELSFELDVTFSSFNDVRVAALEHSTGASISLKSLFDTIFGDAPLSI